MADYELVGDETDDLLNQEASKPKPKYKRMDSIDETARLRSKRTRAQYEDEYPDLVINDIPFKHGRSPIRPNTNDNKQNDSTLWHTPPRSENANSRDRIKSNFKPSTDFSPKLNFRTNEEQNLDRNHDLDVERQRQVELELEREIDFERERVSNKMSAEQRAEIKSLHTEIQDLHEQLTYMELEFQRRHKETVANLQKKYSEQASNYLNDVYERALTKAVSLNEERYRETITRLEDIIRYERREKHAIIKAVNEFLDRLGN